MIETPLPSQQTRGLGCHSVTVPLFTQVTKPCIGFKRGTTLNIVHCAFCMYVCACSCGSCLSLHSLLGLAHPYSICLQMSLWESSVVTKQSHGDGSGKGASHMPDTEFQSQRSAGHVSHMFACGCRGFFCSLYTQTHTQTVAMHMCAHTHYSVLHTNISIVHISHWLALFSFKSCYLTIWCPVLLFHWLTKAPGQSKYFHCAEWQLIWNP